MNFNRFLFVLLAGLFGVGCNGGSGSDGPAAASLSDEWLEFGSVALGDEASQTVTLSNAGGGVLEILSVSLVTGDTRVWTLDRDASVNTLQGGASVDLTVTFKPRQDEEPEEARFQVRTSDSVAPSIYLDAVGEGAPSTIDGDEDGYSPADGDCDDERADVYPGAEEICDGRDNDCDDVIPADEADGDGDGQRVCDGDCDDADRFVYLGAEEICDDKDSDCDGSNLDRVDVDMDGYALCDGDCDETTAEVNPGEAEVCDEVDNDCDGLADNIDEDMDGYSVCANGGDCDDSDPDAHPVVLDPSWTGTQSGTAEEPYASVDMALDNLDEVCRAVWIVDGSFELAVALDGVDVTFGGSGPDAVSLTPPAGSPVFDLTGAANLTVSGLELTGANTTGDGGAIRSVGGNLILMNSRLKANAASGDGGAVSVTSGDLSLENSAFIDNQAADDGGAVTVLSGEFNDVGSTFSGNQGVRGGAILLESSTSSLDGTFLLNNSATDSGGGVQIVGGTMDIWGASLWSNVAVNGGGGLALTDINDANAHIRNCLFQDNDGGSSGGGIAIRGSSAALMVANNTLTGNVATGEGGAILVNAADTDGVSLVSNIWAYSDGTSGLYVPLATGATLTANTGFATAGGKDFEGGASASGTNTSENPLFTSMTNNADPADDDLTLKSASPMVDSGPSDSAWNDPDGSRNDRGYTGGAGAR